MNKTGLFSKRYQPNPVSIKILAVGCMGVLLSGVAYSDQDESDIKILQQRVEQLELLLEQRVNNLADRVEQNSAEQSNKIHIGGYGELHFNAIKQGEDEQRQLDFHRFVIFFGYDFSDRIRFVSELEVEHVIASAGNRGAVELEQAYVEFDIARNMHIQSGVLLLPIGILNETHEPPTFYGVERPVVETTVIPTTWYASAIKFTHQLNNGLLYDLAISEGFKTEDPNADAAAEPFNLKKGKQKASFAAAYDFAYTARVAYTGIAGLNISVYVQHQTDIDQSAEVSYADAATLLGGHIVYQVGDFELRGLAAQWALAGDEAKQAGREKQFGGYAELAWQPVDQFGVFVRQSSWSLQDDSDALQTDIGFNYYPHEQVVIKADVQMQNDDAGDGKGLNVGIGYQF